MDETPLLRHKLASTPAVRHSAVGDLAGQTDGNPQVLPIGAQASERRWV